MTAAPLPAPAGAARVWRSARGGIARATRPARGAPGLAAAMTLAVVLAALAGLLGGRGRVAELAAGAAAGAGAPRPARATCPAAGISAR